MAYTFGYAGRRAHSGEAEARALRVKQYLIREHALEEERIVAIDGGYRETPAVGLYIVPAGTVPPTPGPTLRGNDVQIINKPLKLKPLGPRK